MRVEEEKEFWDLATESGDLRNEWICDKKVSDDDCVNLIAKAIDPIADSNNEPNIVEIGCGIGRLTRPLSRLFPEADFWAYDISEKMIEKALEKIAPLNVCYAVNDGRTIPLRSDIFDAVYSMLLFQHLPLEGVKSYVEEAARLLRPGGVFFFQFIEGTEDEPFSKHHTRSEIAQLMPHFEYEFMNGLIDSNWTWVRAVRI